ncbi:Kinase domain-containing protein isoform 1 [Gossypium australe]|uniref:Kinase domain-containing protein isoform 1 n=1 Tax=Gossypium australe TaxID=47621 RepID=A0A5B6WR26_9ROSI|nr:Kinase domain-containing protein isoform 1 [Gossypium australe]
MTEPSSADLILEFLRRNRFTRAEAALRSELGNRPDLNGFCQKLTLEEKVSGNVLEEENGKKIAGESHGSGSRNSSEVSKELIVKEIECGAGRNGSESQWRNAASTGDSNKPNETRVTSDMSFAFSKNSEDAVLNMQSWNFNASNGPDLLKGDGIFRSSSFSELEKPDKSRWCISEAPDIDKGNVKPGEEISCSGEIKTSCHGNTGKANVDYKYDKFHTSETKELDQQFKTSGAYLKENFADNNRWSKTEEPSSSFSEMWKDCSVKTVFPFPKGDLSIGYNVASASDKREGKKKADALDVRAAIKEQVDEVGRALFFGNQGNAEKKSINGLAFPLAYDDQREELPRLPPVKLKSEEKSLNVNWEEKYERDGPGAKLVSADNTFLIGSYLDVPIGQEINASVLSRLENLVYDDPGGKRNAGGSWLSVSQGIAEDASDLVSGFATIGDGLSESIDYPNEYWESDEYDDDDDVGYMRQPIEDEAWFLAHEIDYPSDNEKGTGHGSVRDPQERSQTKDDDDDQSFAEEDSYFSGERYFQAKNVEPVAASDDPIGLSVTEMYNGTHENDLIAQYDGQLMDEEELNLMRAEPVWQGFVTQTNELIMLGDGEVLNECGRSQLDDICIDNDQHGAVRSIGVGINSDTADFGSVVRESLVAVSSEGDLEYFHDHDGSIGGSRQSYHETERKYIDKPNRDKRKTGKNDSNKYAIENDKGPTPQVKNLADGGFSFPPPLRDGQSVQAGSSKSIWPSNSNAAGEERDDCLTALMESDDMLATWRRKSSNSSVAKSSRDEDDANVRSANSSPSTLSNYGYGALEKNKKEEDEKTSGVREEDLGASLEDEEAAAVQEQVRQIKAQEEEFETFDLKIVHRKNRHLEMVDSNQHWTKKTGFEEDKNFHVVLNSVIAGRYHVTEYLGSAAFSKAIQAHDLHTGMDVCVKIIKNNKDFFDQSLDEIKLLKYVNKHDPADKHHILRLYDYFYYREHLLIVSELLKANLYEFHKFNRESGGEVYFTMPRLQSITIQCLEALQFLHGLGLIHCDLKPENILVKSYSRCEVKVIDLGSSCFETDHLCSYVQSRSYRAPEVILGLPYDKKIDIWSLGCILAELCTGNETNRLEYLIPKKTSLRHRLLMGDQGFVDFVAHLLEVNPKKRPSAAEALKHPWLSYPYEPISA